MRCSLDRKAGTVVYGLALAASAAACGSAMRVDNPFDDGPPPPSLDDAAWTPDEIGHDEILVRGANDLTAMALVRRLRPGWLRARGQSSFSDPSASYPVVYVDEIRHGGLETLHSIPTSEVESMQYFSSADATTRWGTGHPSGVINVVTGR